MENQLSLGLIGAGRIGRVHAQNINAHIQQAKIIAVTDVVEAAAQSCASAYGIAQVYKSHQEILADEQVEAVIICSSTNTHAQFIIEAAQAGKHIFCEKPIALNLETIDEALEAVEQAGVKLQIGFNRRFDPNFKHIKDLVEQGEIGQPHLVRITSRDPAPPPLSYIKVSGGMFLDMSIHDFDMARYLIGDEVESVYATGDALVDAAIGEAGDIDTAVITLNYKNGAIGVIDNSRQAVYGYDQQVEVFGSTGSLSAANETPNRVRKSTVNGIQSANPLYFFLERYTQSYISEVTAFIDAIQDNSPVLVSGLDGRMPVVMALAAKKSLAEKRLVYLSEI